MVATPHSTSHHHILHNSLNTRTTMIDSPQPQPQKKPANIPTHPKPQNKCWNDNPLMTITVGVRGAILESPMQALKSLKIPPHKIKKLMKHIHQISMKYLTYLVLNKRKPDNKQAPMNPPICIPSLVHFTPRRQTLQHPFFTTKGSPPSKKEGSNPTLKLGKT